MLHNHNYNNALPSCVTWPILLQYSMPPSTAVPSHHCSSSFGPPNHTLLTCPLPYPHCPLLRRPRGRSQPRRVVLSTPIAESSITIDGVTAVVDSGLCRAPRYNPDTGISRLVTQRIALDSAEQRRGRAGRTKPGVCFRLWGQADESDMLDATPPEISSADLAPLALTLSAWGCPDGAGLAWLDPPGPAALGQARELLRDLCAVDDKGGLTDTGQCGLGGGGRRQGSVSHPLLPCAHGVEGSRPRSTTSSAPFPQHNHTPRPLHSVLCPQVV